LPGILAGGLVVLSSSRKTSQFAEPIGRGPRHQANKPLPFAGWGASRPASCHTSSAVKADSPACRQGTHG